MQGWRNTMEDAHICELDINADGIHCFGVFDGHGGCEVAKYCAENFLIELKKNGKFKTKNYDEALTETFQKMDEMIDTPEGKKKLLQFKKNSNTNSDNDYQDEEELYSGCTANVILITKTEVIVANAGDSRCVCCEKGQTVELSKDHKPDNEEEKSRIIKAGGAVFDGRVNGNLNLSRAIGDLEYKRNANLPKHQQLIISLPEIKRKNIKDMDFIVMGCDGIWETGPSSKVIDFFKEKLGTEKDKSKYEKIVEDLLDTIIAKDTTVGVGLDNMTCIFISLK